MKSEKIIVTGTQFQRIAIAHTLIKQPKVLIINAATSAHKNSSQELIKQKIRGVLASPGTALPTA